MFFFIVVVLGCNQYPKPSELYNKYRTSVVLIKNSYYFEARIDNNFTFYYTMRKNEPIIYINREEVIQNANVNYGTGFFISDKGEIVTNRHVIYPNKHKESLIQKFKEYIVKLRIELKEKINKRKQESENLKNYLSKYYKILDVNERKNIKENYNSIVNKINDLYKYLDKLNFNFSNLSVELKRNLLGVSFDDTYVTSDSDYSECVAIKKSNRKEVDLALMQLKNKNTPSRVKNYFNISDVKPEKTKVDDDVYMIGFNQGIALANTENGIKSQFTKGSITQDTDNNKVLYSIPTLKGSSGSPIIDRKGNLIAINFSKTRDFQGFSFGIPSSSLVNFYQTRNRKIFKNDKSLNKINEERNAYISREKVTKNYYKLVEMRDKYDNKQKNLIKEIDSIATPFQQLYKDYMEKKERLTDNERHQIKQRLRQMQKQIRTKQNQEKKKIQKQREKEKDSIINIMEKKITEYAKQNGYSYIFGSNQSSNILYGDKNKNITDEVIEMLNKENENKGEEKKTESKE